MRNQLKTVKEIAKLTGITIRTLHYYDEIGLLKPSDVSEAGYRLYNKNDITIIQEILFLKEIGFELKQIKEIVNNPSFDEKTELKKQKEILILKKKRIENLIKLVDDKLECNCSLSFSEFDESHIIAKQKEYHKEVLQRWKNTDSYREFESNHSKSNNQFTDLDKKSKEIFGKIAEYMNYPPSDKRVQGLISLWQDYITQNHYNCTNQMLECLSLMYVEDKRFKAYFNNLGDNLAHYIGDAIKFYCQVQGI